MHFMHKKIGVPKWLIKDTAENAAECVFEPLPQGYGVTLGNSLRRVLLSSLPGVAVTGLKIPGVTHEYSVIEGVQDSVIDIILNLKDLRFNMEGDDTVWISLSAKGDGEIIASQFELPSGVEILNPDQYITRITGLKKPLEMKVRVEKGVGYMSFADLRKREDDLEVLLVDASFSPVKMVKYDVKGARVGQNISLDKLVLDVVTDGSITSKDALVFASNILTSYYGLINQEGIIVEPKFLVDMDNAKVDTDEQKKDKVIRETYTPIEVLQLSPRTVNALLNGNVGSLEQLLECTERKLSHFRGFGKKGMTEVRDALKTRELTLKDEDDGYM